MSLGENILVTGGAGFIGSALVNKLVTEGKNVTVYDNLCRGKKEHIAHHLDKEGFEFIEADLLDTDELDKAMQGKIFYERDLDYCKGCGLCAEGCPVNAIKMVPEKK